MPDSKTVTVNIKKATVADLEAEVVKSKIYEAVLSSVRSGGVAEDGFSFGLSFGLSWDTAFLADRG